MSLLLSFSFFVAAAAFHSGALQLSQAELVDLHFGLGLLFLFQGLVSIFLPKGIR